MNTTKSKVFALVMVLVLSFSLVACGDDKTVGDLTGTSWALNSGTQGENTIDKEALETLLGGEMLYTFNDGGKVTLSLAETEVEGTWAQDGNTVSLNIQGETGTMTIDGDKLVLEQNGIKIDFIKK